MNKVKQILEGNVRVATRLIRDIEDDIPESIETLKGIYPYTGNAYVIGITGSPGVGKSTLTNGLISAFRKKGKTIGVLAIDPTSPFTGGAILGDRVRMQQHALDSGVFVRSLATRGALGGLSKAVGDSIHVMDSMGKDIIIVETVGAGQQEVDIMNHAHTVIVVLMPGMGDAVQTIKAGVMEIADVFAINKADRNFADNLYLEISILLDMVAPTSSGWRPLINKVGNVNDEQRFVQDIEGLVDSITEHQKYMSETGMLEERKRRKAEYELNGALQACILDPVLKKLNKEGTLEIMISRIIARNENPHTLAEEVARKFVHL